MFHHHHIPTAVAVAAIIAILVLLAIFDSSSSRTDRRGIGAALMAVLLVFIVLSMTGCAAMQRPDELAWQGLHAVDTLGTSRMIGDPCYREGHPLTRELIGSQPNEARVAAWGVGGAFLHAGITELLIDHDHPKLADAWEAVSLADTGWSVYQAWHVGIRIGAPNKLQPADGCAL